MPGYRITAGDATAVDNFSPGLYDMPYSGTIIASGDYKSTDPAPTEFNTLGALGLEVILDVTAASGGGGVTLNIEGFDPASGKWFTFLTSALIVATGTTAYRVGPWTVAAANVAVQANLCRTMRVRPVGSGVRTTLTYSVGGHMSQ